jgi:hypothetical protein
MLAKELFDLRGQFHQSGTLFAYCGYVTEPVLTGVGDALKLKLVHEDMDTKTARNVFAVFVEQMQNIIRYSAEKDEHVADSETAGGAPSAELRYGILTIGRDGGGGFVVKAGNLVEKGDIDRLRRKLEHVSQADKEELKAMYKETLRSGPEEGSKGASIGFIEIARRVSRPIKFDFVDADDEHAFFALDAEI